MIYTEFLRKQLVVELCRDRESNPGRNYDLSDNQPERSQRSILVNREKLKYINFIKLLF